LSDFLAEVVFYTEEFKTGRIYQRYAGAPSPAGKGRREKDNFSLSANLTLFDKRSEATQSRWSSRSEARKNDLDEERSGVSCSLEVSRVDFQD